MIDRACKGLHRPREEPSALPVSQSGRFVLALGTIVALAGVAGCARRDRDHWHAEATQEAIELGRDYAWSLLWGRKEQLLAMSIALATLKVQSANLTEMGVAKVDTYDGGGYRDDFTDICRTWGIPEERYEQALKRYHHVLAPLIYPDDADRYERLGLLVFEKRSGFVVMTFAYTDWYGGILEVPGKGKMLFAIAAKYYRPRSSKTGHWVVFDYDHRCTMADYRSWLLKHGKEAAESWITEAKAFIVSMPDPAVRRRFLEDGQREVDVLSEWASSRARSQIEELERSLQSAAPPALVE